MGSKREKGTENSGARATLRKRVGVLRDARGVVLVEYAMLIGIVGITCAAAFISIGVALVNNFGLVRAMLLIPFP